MRRRSDWGRCSLLRRALILTGYLDSKSWRTMNEISGALGVEKKTARRWIASLSATPGWILEVLDKGQGKRYRLFKSIEGLWDSKN